MTNPPDTTHVEPYADAQASYLEDWPVPYRLTPLAEALLAEPGQEADPEPEAGS